MSHLLSTSLWEIAKSLQREAMTTSAHYQGDDSYIRRKWGLKFQSGSGERSN